MTQTLSNNIITAAQQREIVAARFQIVEEQPNPDSLSNLGLTTELAGIIAEVWSLVVVATTEQLFQVAATLYGSLSFVLRSLGENGLTEIGRTPSAEAIFKSVRAALLAQE